MTLSPNGTLFVGSRDWLGDDIPSGELNRAPEAGMHFGFPYCHGAAIPDPEFGRNGHVHR